MGKPPARVLSLEAQATIAKIRPLFRRLTIIWGTGHRSKYQEETARLITRIAALSAQAKAQGATAEVESIELLAPGGGAWWRCPTCQGRGRVTRGGADETRDRPRSIDGEPMEGEP